MAALPKLSALHNEAALRAPLLSTLTGIAAAVGLAIALPPSYAAAASVATMGLASLSALLALDARRREQADALARNVGELNVRLAAARIKLDSLQARTDSEPLRQADFAPTRAALSELTAEVGLLGGVLRDVATAVSEHEEKLSGLPAEEEKAPSPRDGASLAATRESPAAGQLVAQPAAQVDADLRKRDEVRLAALKEAFAAGGLEIHLQPVASLPQRRTVGYEALARLRMPDGALLQPAEFLAALERAGQGANLDAQVLTQVLAIAGHLNGKGLDHFISLNLSRGTWAESRALGSIARVLDTYRAQSARVVIEIPQRVWRSLDPTRLGIIGGMAAGGLRFALDQVTDLRLDPAALSDRGVRFVKASAPVLAGLTQGSSGLDIDAGDLAQLLRRAGVEFIGERAETDRMVADLIDLDIRFAQGFAISQPRAVKPEAFQPATTPAVATGSAEALVDNLPMNARPAPPRVAAQPVTLAQGERTMQGRGGAQATVQSAPSSAQATVQSAPSGAKATVQSAPSGAKATVQSAPSGAQPDLPVRVPFRAVLRRANG
jgi:cyclic-di-GMP phosphodiesterase TipF (flagellum assembly factor)